ncbi:MAG: outer membrane protein assembly factor BamD [Alphaproteobacteria bacterium]|nr:outer membrane protein assembly factor BamD [Alphaproteobacteria bacterium]
MLKKLAVCAIVAAACFGCSSSRKQQDLPPPQEMFDQGRALFDRREFLRSAEKFDLLEREYPFSELVPRAQVMSAFAFYKARRYDDTIMAVNRFLHLNPADKDAPWAYYIRAQALYEQVSDFRRDQKITEQAYQAFSEVVRRFPDSEYAKDARQKLVVLTDFLAGHEMEIGRFYQANRMHTASLNRFLTVLERYPRSVVLPEALLRITEVYITIGLPEDARKYAVLLGTNFPDSKWYARAYELVNRHAD